VRHFQAERDLYFAKVCFQRSLQSLVETKDSYFSHHGLLYQIERSEEDCRELTKLKEKHHAQTLRLESFSKRLLTPTSAVIPAVKSEQAPPLIDSPPLMD